MFDGQFYEADFQKLDEQIRSCFNSRFGPGDLPIDKRERRVFGVVSAHAGYMFSGPAMAWSYKEIAESKFPDVYIILGVNHSGFGRDFSIDLRDYETPFGVVKVDREIDLGLREEHINNEHSIEVQLPFLQFANKSRLKDIRIFPILVNNYDYEKCKELGRRIAKLKKRICIIASSDFTHYGSMYGYAPFVFNKRESMYELDKGAIEFICKLDGKGFLEYKEKKGATICGAGPIIITIEACKILGSKEGKLLHYYTSGDVVKDYDNMVGYASIVLR